MKSSGGVMLLKENNAQRRVALTAAVILAILVLFYLGGLLGQLITGYQDWLSQDGMSGGVTMPLIRPGPLQCLANAFTKDGLMGTLFIIAAVGAIVLYVKLIDKFKSKDLDERNFARSKSGTYGTAGWMTPKEMKKVLEITTPDKAKGIILGQKDGSVVCLPVDTRLNKHLCVFGASGTMKSRAIIRPYLFQSLKRGDSVVITDPKGELYNDTAEMFRRKGYKVRVFNLVTPEHSDSWNCMADLNGDTMMAQILTNVIISNTGKGKADHFWDNGEGNLLKSLILYIDSDPTRSPDAKHLPAVYQMLTQNTEKSLSAIFDKLPISHPAKAPYNLFAQASDTVRAGIVLGLGTRLQVLQNQAIRNITSKNELDLSEPGKTKCAYFVILSDQESSTEFISSLFFSFLFIKLARYADSTPDQRCKVPVNIVFDEFNNVGQLDTYPRRLSVVRSRAIQVCHVVQSLAQFKNRYPEEQWAEIVGNCDTQVMLGCTEEQTAEYFSARSGDMTVDINSTMVVKHTIAVAQMIPQYRETAGMGKRRLLTPDEVFRIPNTEMLIIIRGEKVLQASKFDFTGHPYAKRMIKTNIFDYYPEDKIPRPQTEIEPDEPPITFPPAQSIPDTSDNQKRTGGRNKAPGQTGIGKPRERAHPDRSPLYHEETAGDMHANQAPPCQTDIKKHPDEQDAVKISPVCQTETEIHLDGLNPPQKSPVCQTETKIHLDEPPLQENGHLYQTENVKPGDGCIPDKKHDIQSQSDENMGGDDDRHAVIPAQLHTDPEKPKKKTDRRARNQKPPPDYTSLLESFNQQPNSTSKQSLKTPAPTETEKQNNFTPEEDFCMHAGHHALYQPECSSHPGIDDLPDLDIHSGHSHYSGDLPPDDF